MDGPGLGDPRVQGTSGGRRTVTADPPSAQVGIETCTSGVPPRHIRSGEIGDCEELERLQAPSSYAGVPAWT